MASETWLQVARDLPSFSGDADGFRGWVATIARHRADGHLRHARRRPRPATVTAADWETWAAADGTAGQELELRIFNSGCYYRFTHAGQAVQDGPAPSLARCGYGLSVTIQAIGPTLVVTALFR